LAKAAKHAKDLLVAADSNQQQQQQQQAACSRQVLLVMRWVLLHCWAAFLSQSADH
jgi:hypothetical protein